MKKWIEIKENGLFVLFGVRDDGVVELENFSPDSVEVKRDPAEDPGICRPLVELHPTGTTTVDMHGYKHIMSAASLDMKYRDHSFGETAQGKELVICLESGSGLLAEYHMAFFTGIPVVQTYTRLENTGGEDIGLEYVSSFLYRRLCGNGERPYFDKTDLYVPYNGWSSESRWVRTSADKVNLTGMPVDGFNTPGFGSNRYCYTGHGSWTSCEYLPMGFVRDTETGETYCFQIETSGQWHVEYGSDFTKRLYLALSGATGMEHGWWKNLKPGQSFTTVPVRCAWTTAC